MLHRGSSTSSALLSVCAMVALIALAAATPLDDYIKKPEPLFAYSDTGIRLNGTGWNGYLWNFTSQQWLTSQDSSASVWVHTRAFLSDFSVNLVFLTI